MNFEEYNILGNVIDTTWGRGSTNNEMGSIMSIKAKLLGENQLVLNYACVVSFGNPEERRKEFDKLSQESATILNSAVKRIKDNFKDASGRTLKTEQLSDDEDWELLSLGQYSGRRDAYYRRAVVLQLD